MNTMRNLKSILIMAVVAITISSCEKNNEPILEPVESKTVTNFHAPQTTDFTKNPPATSGEFAKFSFKTGAKVTGDDWDIAFRGTRILVNGGTAIGLVDEPNRTANASLAIETGTFASIVKAPADSNFKQDAANTYALPHGSGKGWYTYNGQTNLVSRIAGKVIVVKTIEGNYAKMEITSYYKDNDSSNSANGRYYTFNYVYNPNAGDKSLE